MPANKLNKIVNQQDTGDDIVSKMNLNIKYSLVSACSDGSSLFYKINNQTGNL